MTLLAATAAAALAFACNEAADSLSTPRGAPGQPGSGSGNVDGTGSLAGASGTPEKLKFTAAEPDLLKSCGNGCHDTGTTSPPPPMFLQGPDVYASIKGHNGIVVADVYSSILLTKGPHAGPAVSALPELETKIVDWLTYEATLLQAAALPSTPAFAVTAGTNTVDLTPAASGLTGVSLRFDAALVGSMLQLTNITVVAPAGPDVHVVHPRFVRVLGAPGANGKSNVDDPADSFSNSDQTIANGKEAVLTPGAVLFSNESWRPFDIAADKIRIEMSKLEVGKVTQTSGQAQCKDPAGFAQRVLPRMRTQTTNNGTCGGCHGNGLAGLSLASNDNATVCQQVLGKMNPQNVPQSLIITKVSGGGATHNGGTVTDPNGWRDLFVNNAGVFF